MIQYRFAFNPAGLLVDALRLTAENRAVYRCPACGGDVVPVLPTQDITQHFRHKNTGECNHESYLHSAAKKALVQSFLYHAKRGGYYVQLQNKLCISDVFNKARIEEAEDGGTIPDITLDSKHGDNRRLFIEIYVTHRVNWHSALMRYYPTIEIPIRSEGDIERLREDTLYLNREGVLLYENRLEIAPFLSSPLYLTPHQISYIERQGWGHFDPPDTSKPSTLCALLELGALDAQGRPNFARLEAIKEAYRQRSEAKQ